MYYYHNKYFIECLSVSDYGEDLLCEKFTVDVLLNYIEYIKEVNQITNAITINSYLHNISPIIKYAIIKGYIATDFTTLRTWEILWAFASIGIRASELTNLKIGNVDLLNRSLVVNHTKNKGPRVIPISEALRAVLDEYLEIRGGERLTGLYFLRFMVGVYYKNLLKFIAMREVYIVQAYIYIDIPL
ncbi:tyrosine-type recombinase/integrase [Clostridium sporogenes]|uniref:Tyrosine-type recombinase/integrase n=1 Tax=Clostridium sporogenes TaxID=1509 RepID=A0AAE4FM37_CLOSG|nr:tyrosine-type recombinase/integrase [Clostridium sporogenes]